MHVYMTIYWITFLLIFKEWLDHTIAVCLDLALFTFLFLSLKGKKIGI